VNASLVTYPQQLIDHESSQREVLPQRSLVKDGWQADFFTFRLPPNSTEHLIALPPN
jgi:hypothetical protein